MQTAPVFRLLLTSCSTKSRLIAVSGIFLCKLTTSSQATGDIVRYWRSISALLSALVVACSGPQPPETAAQAGHDSLSTTSESPAVAHANAISRGGPRYQDGFIDADGLRLHYVEAGEGRLVLLYHGFPSFWYSFFDQMEALKQDYHVVAVDGLGAGLSDKPRSLSHYSVESLAAQLDAVARHHAGDDTFIFIGHDWGAALGFAYAEANPHRLDAIVGMSAPSYNVFLNLVRSDAEQQQRSAYMQTIRETSYQAVIDNPPGERIWRQAYSKLIEDGHLSEAEGELFRQAMASADAMNGGFNWYRANMPPPAAITSEDHWPNPPARIVTPALLIVGATDTTFVPAHIDMMIDVVDSLSVVSIPEMGHWTLMQDPEISTGAILTFLETVTPRED